MKILLCTPALTVTASVLILSQFSLAQAEEKRIEVKSGDTLSTIIAEYYPSYKNNKTLTQALFEANSASFKNQSIHQLIVGRTLILPDLNTLPNIQASEEPQSDTTVAKPNKKELDDLKNQLKVLETEKAQLANQVKELSATPNKPTEALSTTAEVPDTAGLVQQLDAIESANEQILADKNRLIKEQEDLKKQLQTLEADKKQLETQLATQAASAATNEAATTSTDTAPAEGVSDTATLIQQLDEIESANEQILADKKQLEKERDDLKQQIQTLQADNKQAEAASPTASTVSSAASGTADTPDPATLIQQLDQIEAANKQLLNDKNKLQSDLETAQQQLKERDQTMAALTGQVTEKQQQLENSQKELLLANAARASAELNKASLEKQRGSWLPWLLALITLPIGWLLGRRSKEPSVPTPEPSKTASPAVLTPVTPEAATTAQFSPLAPVANAQTVAAANDDNPDTAIKLDIVRAYLDLRDPVAASALLKEVMREGGRQQQQEAREILSFLG